MSWGCCVCGAEEGRGEEKIGYRRAQLHLVKSFLRVGRVKSLFKRHQVAPREQETEEETRGGWAPLPWTPAEEYKRPERQRSVCLTKGEGRPSPCTPLRAPRQLSSFPPSPRGGSSSARGRESLVLLLGSDSGVGGGDDDDDRKRRGKP